MSIAFRCAFLSREKRRAKRRKKRWKEPLDVENILDGRQEIIIPLLVVVVVVVVWSNRIFSFSVFVAKPFKFNVNQYRCTLLHLQNRFHVEPVSFEHCVLSTITTTTTIASHVSLCPLSVYDSFCTFFASNHLSLYLLIKCVPVVHMCAYQQLAAAEWKEGGREQYQER